MEVIRTVDVIVLEVSAKKMIQDTLSDYACCLPNCPGLGHNIVTDNPPNNPMPGVAVNFVLSHYISAQSAHL